MLAEQFSEYILQHVAALDGGDEKGYEQQAFALETRYRQRQQRRYVTDAIDGEHDAPLLFADALEEASRIAGDCCQRRHGQEAIDGNEDRKEPIPVDPEQVVLHRNDHQKHAEQDPVITAPRVRQRHIFAQCGKRDKCEQQDDAALAEQEGNGDGGNHDPPRLDARVKIGECRGERVALACAPPAQRGGNGACDSQYTEKAEE